MSSCGLVLTLGASLFKAAQPIREYDAISQEQSTTDDMTFEQALSALEEIVQQLESGDVPLDQSITLYEQGEALRKQCQSRLDAAQQRIEQIVADKDGMATGSQPFDAGQ